MASRIGASRWTRVPAAARAAPPGRPPHPAREGNKCSIDRHGHASRNDQCFPSVARTVGYRISADRRQLAIFLVARQAEQVLADVRTTGLAAVVFTQPSTHKTVQVKGGGAQVTALEEGDWPAISAYADDFVAEICPLGYAEPLMRKLVECTPQQVVAVRFTPTAAFGQTPGPRAGAVLAEAKP